jgi:hypothetical protein
MNLKAHKQTVTDGIINQLRGGKPSQAQFEAFRKKAYLMVATKPGTVTSMGKTYLAIQVNFSKGLEAGELVEGIPALTLAKAKKNDDGILLLYAAEGGWNKGDLNEEETNLE